MATESIAHGREQLAFGVDGSGPRARVHIGGPRQCLRVDILLDVRHFAISTVMSKTHSSLYGLFVA